MLGFAWIDYSPARYGDYYFPAWADAIGWLMTFASVTWIPVMAVYLLCREEGLMREVSHVADGTRGRVTHVHRHIITHARTHTHPPPPHTRTRTHAQLTLNTYPKAQPSALAMYIHVQECMRWSTQIHAHHVHTYAHSHTALTHAQMFAAHYIFT